MSVIVVDGDVSYFLAGDTSYTQNALIEQKVDGVSPDEATALLTLQRILRYARERLTVNVPSYDPESGARPAKTVTIPVDGIVLA